MINSQKRPSKWLYYLAVFILIIGILVTVQVTKYGMEDLKQMERFVVPGQHQIVFDKPDDYKLFYEYKSNFDNRTFETPNELPNLTITLINTETNEEAILVQSTETQTYTVDENEGILLSTISIKKPGTYELSAFYENGDNQELVLAVGQGASDFAFIIILALASMLISSVTAVLLIGYTYLGRK